MFELFRQFTTDEIIMVLIVTNPVITVLAAILIIRLTTKMKREVDEIVGQIRDYLSFTENEIAKEEKNEEKYLSSKDNILCEKKLKDEMKGKIQNGIEKGAENEEIYSKNSSRIKEADQKSRNQEILIDQILEEIFP